MNLEYQYLLPEDFAPQSRVWIYQSSRMFLMSEALDMEKLLQQFAEEWRSHGADVKAYANLLFGQFVVLMADETQAGVSGCSTDSSVRFIKVLGQQYNVDFFNRTSLAFFIKDKIQVLPMNQLGYAYENGFITADTLYFNNLVLTKAELETQWIIPVKDSWLAARLPVKSAS
ncbi:MAG TPA: hypothetical protein VHK91_07500 [Flavisolibacter sp.]|jgi:hypothetical protein|nr:hypothetical protein [Flavisolibacter sp.]